MLVRVPSSWASSHPAKMRALRDNRRRNVANVDVVPSIVDLLGLDQRADARRLRDRLDGYSLFSPVPADRTIIGLNNNPVRHWEHKGFGVFWRDWRFVFTTVQGPRLFDLADDPRQQHDLWQQAPPTARRRVHQTIEGNPFLSRIWREYNRPKPRLFANQP
jgi:arylsulfatase A-like enzyme